MLCHVLIVMLQLHILLVSKLLSVFCGIMKQNHRSQFSGNSKISKDNLRQMLKASKRGIQILYRLALLVTLTEMAGPV